MLKSCEILFQQMVVYFGICAKYYLQYSPRPLVFSYFWHKLCFTLIEFTVLSIFPYLADGYNILIYNIMNNLNLFSRDALCRLLIVCKLHWHALISWRITAHKYACPQGEEKLVYMTHSFFKIESLIYVVIKDDNINMPSVNNAIRI